MRAPKDQVPAYRMNRDDCEASQVAILSLNDKQGRSMA